VGVLPTGGYHEDSSHSHRLPLHLRNWQSAQPDRTFHLTLAAAGQPDGELRPAKGGWPLAVHHFWQRHVPVHDHLRRRAAARVTKPPTRHGGDGGKQ